jgi:tyrosinase
MITTRRAFVGALSTTAALVVFSSRLVGLRALAQQGARVRRSLGKMAIDDPDLAAYRDFVGLMQRKDQGQPLSWVGYSRQHGDADGDFKYCPHGDWYFLPWHRGYVLMYEAAVRELVSHPDFAMPYWDWTEDRAFPPAFSDKLYKGSPNPLYVDSRTLSDKKRWPLPDSIVGPDVMKRIYKETSFQLFGTSKNPEQDSLDAHWVSDGGGAQAVLEGTPHNTIHNSIGGFMPTAGSPRDPIFMMHHGNIDRVWAYWNSLGRNNLSGMSPADQALWLEMEFKDNYLDSSGKAYSRKVKELQNTESLGYTYPDLPKPDGLIADPERARRLLSLFSRGEGLKQLHQLILLPTENTVASTPVKPLTKEVHVPDAVRDLLTSAVPPTQRSPEIFALIKDMAVDPTIEAVRVFVNAGNVTEATPDSDPHFVTQISFLKHDHGSAHGHHKAPPSALIDLSGTVRELSRQNLLRDDTISVQLLAVRRPGVRSNAKAEVVPAAVEVAVL